MQATHHPPCAVPVTPAVVLRCAAEYIRWHGWVRGAFFDPDDDGPFPAACATGAIRMAIHGDLTATFAPTAPDSQEHRLAVTTQRILAGYLDESFDPEETSSIDAIGDWNDEEGRTPAEVITTLTDAADDWDRTHRPPGEQP
jgi:hypothetical protein